MVIPRVLHQIWLGSATPPASAMQTWRDLHPDWNYTLWTDQNRPSLKLQALYDAFEGFPHAQADILRYEILDRYGGVYVDADSFCVQPLNDGFLQTPWACRNAKGVANGFLGFPSKHPLIAAVIKSLEALSPEATRNEALLAPDLLYEIIYLLTGPQCFTKAYLSFIHKSLTDVVLYPEHYFLSSTAPAVPDQLWACEGSPMPFALHFGGSTLKLYNQPDRIAAVEQAARQLRESIAAKKK